MGDNILLCDTRGVIYQGRDEGMNQWKSAHAANTEARTLEEAMEGADSFFGLSVAGALLRIWSDPWPTSPSSSPWPTPIRKLPRKPAKCRTRSSQPGGRITNRSTTSWLSVCLPRRAGRAHERKRNENRRRRRWRASARRRPRRSRRRLFRAPPALRTDYIIPAFRPTSDFGHSRRSRRPPSIWSRRRKCPRLRPQTRLSARLDPTVSMLQAIHEEFKQSAPSGFRRAKKNHDSGSDRRSGGPWHPGPDRARRTDQGDYQAARPDGCGLYRTTMPLSRGNRHYTEYLYTRRQREGYLYRDCQRLVHRTQRVLRLHAAVATSTRW